jgi:uncharacterized membrane protein
MSRAIRRRVIAGLLVALPIAITFFILFWLYGLLDAVVFTPMSWVIGQLLEASGVASDQLPGWWYNWVLPVINLATLPVLLYFLGLAARGRMHRAIDWVLLRVPVVTTIYKAVRGAFQAVEMQEASANTFQRVVLVEFPHPGMKAPAFVTRSMTDVTTGRTILCVYVPTTPVPSSGYLLMVPEERVVELDWNIQETLQTVISGGLTAPETIDYFGQVGTPTVAEPTHRPPSSSGNAGQAGPTESD